MDTQERKLFLLDAYALIYRAFFALNKNPRINSKGLNTSAIIGFMNTLHEVINTHAPSHIGVAFDLGAPSERTTEYSFYKANRESMPDDIRAAVPYIIELIKAFRIPIYAVEGYEADDVIGTLARKAEQAGFVTYMMTPDKDFGQLVTDRTFMLKPARTNEPATVMGPREVCDKYGIERPSQVIDLLGLWGDSSDNIPGIPGIGEKTAVKLIVEYGSMENIIANADKLKGKLKENVMQFAEQGLMSKMLATINTSVPVDFDEEELRLKSPDIPMLTSILEELEMKNTLKRFVGSAKKEKVTQTVTGQTDLFSALEDSASATETAPSYKDLASTVHEYKIIETQQQFDELVERLGKAERVAMCLDTRGQASCAADIVGMAFATEAHKACYVPIVGNKDRLNMLASVLVDEKIEKVGYNIKNDISALGGCGLELKGTLFDIMIAHYLIEPEQRHSLDYIVETLAGYRLAETAPAKTSYNLFETEIDTVSVEGVSEKADLSLQLYELLVPLLNEREVMWLFRDVEMPLVPVLSDMECNGVKIDIDNLKRISADFGGQIAEIEKEIYKHAGVEFNIDSPRQLGEVLFDRLKIDTSAKKTKKGQYMTSEDVLHKLAPRHPIINFILEYRGLKKLKSTYLDALPELVNQRDGLIHTTFNQAVTATGRLSSTAPNLQNIPVRTERGREIRKAFVPRAANYVIMAADYSQIELRIITHLSRDPHMVDAFNKGHDIHAATAARVFKVDINEVTKEQRRIAKTVNFGIIYGISVFGLAERLSIPREQAKSIIESYFSEYKGIKDYMNKSVETAREKGYAETMLGRRRYLRDINASNSVVRGFAERNAINAPVQGSAADMIKIAMVSVYKELRRNNMKAKMILQVHDELVFDTPQDELDKLRAIVEKCMVEALPLSIPVVVDINTGSNWLEAH